MKPSRNNDNLNNLRVLVADDDKDILTIIKFILHDLGIFQIQLAENGKEAVSYLQDAAEPLDFVICDWMMPYVSGVEVLRLVRKKHPDLPFLMLTAKGAVRDVAEAKAAGVDAYIVKPFAPEEIHKKIRGLVRNILG
ncbi:MAG TPA: response regulator [Rhodospirillales bacterium]|nr:response regulator [Rhodospirillales bacterium]